jgi:hypothetical protein
MSSTNAQTISAPHTFDRTVADLKQGVVYATTAQAQVSEKAMKTAKDLAEFNRGTLEAFTQVSEILAAGSQDLSRQMAASSQSALAEALSGFRAFVAAKTVKERLEDAGDGAVPLDALLHFNVDAALQDRRRARGVGFAGAPSSSFAECRQ